MIRTSIVACVVLTATAFAQSRKASDWKPALSYGGAPECPQHIGRRVSYSATAGIGPITAEIIGTSERTSQEKCTRTADLVFRAGSKKVLPLPHPDTEQYEIADFSPDSRSILLVLDKTLPPPSYKQIRNIEVSVVDVSHPEIRVINVWDLFGWEKCEATVEPQGFTKDGRVLLLARPSTSSSKVRNDCVPDEALYATDLKSKPIRLATVTTVPRFGTQVAYEHQACKSDPDIVEACFTIRGRLNVWNGSPSLRIWHVGTKRILGVDDDFPLRSELDAYDLLNGAVWGNFEVCPFTKDRPGVMRMVCVESANHLTYEKY